jgi:hypothetical protein
VPKPIVILPICSHKNSFQQLSIIKTIVQKFSITCSDANLVNVATDGDPCRKKFLRANRIEIRDKNSPFYSMKLFDTKLLFGDLCINLDPEHLVKRLRGVVVLDKKSIKLISKSFNKQHIKLLFPNIKSSLSNPKDYQNVPAAVSLFLEMPKIDDQNFIQSKVSDDIKKEIKLFNFISDGLLNIFTNVRISLHEQLSSLARNKSEFLTYALYNDLQFTIQDAFWVVYQFQKHANDFTEEYKVFLFQLGTDQLESLFGIFRTQTHSRNFTLFELLQVVFFVPSNRKSL